MVIRIYTGPLGSGKSRQMLAKLLTTSRRYLVALPRIDLTEEQRQSLERAATELGAVLPPIREAHSEVTTRENVARQIEDAAQDFSDREHAIVLITHENLRSHDLRQFKGWHLRVDEIPDGITSGSFRASASSSYLEATYDLEPVLEGADWRHVILRDNAPRIRDVMQDAFVGKIVQFHKHVASPQNVFVNLEGWPVKGKTSGATGTFYVIR